MPSFVMAERLETSLPAFAGMRIESNMDAYRRSDMPTPVVALRYEQSEYDCPRDVGVYFLDHMLMWLLTQPP